MFSYRLKQDLRVKTPRFLTYPPNTPALPPQLSPLNLRDEDVSSQMSWWVVRLVGRQAPYLHLVLPKLDRIVIPAF